MSPAPADGRRDRRSRLRVGVTVFLRDEHQRIRESGIDQNCFFLLQTLKASPVVEWSCIVAGGPGHRAGGRWFIDAFKSEVIDTTAAMEALDVVIELGAPIDPAWGKAFVARGGRIVAMRLANEFIVDAERLAFDLPSGSLMSGVPYHEVWTLAAFERTCARYQEIGYRAPVRLVPHLWSPALLEGAKASSGEVREFRYVPGRARWRTAILEPNLSSVNTAHIPLLAIESAYRRRPSFLEVIRVFNAPSLRENQIFVKFARSLDAIKNGMATFEDSFSFIEIMGRYADVVVSHHWGNAQNYLYYEALYGGYPLVHNSAMIDGCGYRYADFDPEDGGQALLQAFLQHDHALESYLADGRRLIAKLAPTAEANIRQYSWALAGLFDADRVPGPEASRRDLAIIK